MCTSLDQSTEITRNELRNQVLASAMTEIAAFQRYINEATTSLVQKENKIYVNLNQVLDNEMKEAKVQEARFEKTRNNLDSSIDYLNNARKAKKIKPEEITMAETKKENNETSFKLVGLETIELLKEVNMVSEYVIMDGMCDFLDAYKEYFQSVSRYLNEIIPSLYKFKHYVEESKQRRATVAVQTAPESGEQLTNVPKLFGENILITLTRQASDVPVFVQKVCDWMYEHSLEVPNIFKNNPDLELFIAEKSKYSRDPDNVIIPPDADSHVIASLLKMYFRELPEPLLTRRLYIPLVETNNIKSRIERIQTIGILLDELPDENYQTFRLFMWLLHCIVLCSDVNKVNSGVLASSIAPSLLKPEGDEDNSNFDPFEPRAVIEFIIHHYDDIFPDAPVDEKAIIVEDLAEEEIEI